MDIVKLQGITDAIEAEVKQPSPSHNNLARLTAMFMREIIAGYQAPVPERNESVVKFAEATREVVKSLSVAADKSEPDPAPKPQKAPRKK